MGSLSLPGSHSDFWLPVGIVAVGGRHIVQIYEEPGSPQFAFTVGLYYQFLQPEILIMGIDLAMSAHILNDIRDMVLPFVARPLSRDAVHLARQVGSIPK